MIELTTLSFTLTLGFSVALGLFLGIHLEAMSRESELRRERAQADKEKDPYGRGGD